jgi:hypothetical protein
VHACTETIGKSHHWIFGSNMRELRESETGAMDTSPTSHHLFFGRLTRTVFVVYLITLTALLLRPDSSGDTPTDNLTTWLDRMCPVAHLISFAILAALAFACRWPVPRWVVVLFIAGYAGGTELLQGSIEGRHCSWMDWYLDLIGAAIGVGSLMVVPRICQYFKRNTGDTAGGCLATDNDDV